MRSSWIEKCHDKVSGFSEKEREILELQVQRAESSWFASSDELKKALLAPWWAQAENYSPTSASVASRSLAQLLVRNRPIIEDYHVEGKLSDGDLKRLTQRSSTLIHSYFPEKFTPEDPLLWSELTKKYPNALKALLATHSVFTEQKDSENFIHIKCLPVLNPEGKVDRSAVGGFTFRLADSLLYLATERNKHPNAPISLPMLNIARLSRDPTIVFHALEYMLMYGIDLETPKIIISRGKARRPTHEEKKKIFQLLLNAKV